MTKEPLLRPALAVWAALPALLALAACAGTDPAGTSTSDTDDAGLRDVLRPFTDVGGDDAPADSSDEPDAGEDLALDTSVDADAGGDEPDVTVLPDVSTQDVTEDSALDVTAEPDACAGVPSCAIPAVGTRCENDVLVSCYVDADGCLTELRVDCALTGDICNVVGPEAECQEEVTGGDGETCAEARELTVGVQTLNTTGFINDYNDFDACGSLLNDARGPDVVYSITLAAGATLTVSMESSDTDYDVVAAIGDACPGLTAACRDYSDESIFLYPEEVSVTNTTGSPRVYYVVADGDRSDDAGPLTLTATVTGP